MTRFISIFLTLILFATEAQAQSILDDLGNKRGGTGQSLSSDIATEKVKKISASKRIFILTNENGLLQKGDFFTALLGDSLVFRGLTAKVQKNIIGIKVLKIYSLNLWRSMERGIDVKILRGDDSYFMKKKEQKNEDVDDSLIQAEDDLYNSTSILDDDLGIDENKNRAIKQDNLISASLGKIEGVDQSGGSARYTQISAQWAYQIADNIFGEISYGQNVVKDFPSDGLDTKMTNLTFRGKYTFEAPFYSYLQPYAGFQLVNADSPGAGVADGVASNDQLNNELQLVDDSKKKSFIFGVTWLKRLVPGWFVRVDLGTDIMGLGFTIEF